MPEPKSKPEKKRGTGARAGLLGVLLAAVGALALWLSDCVPGFGIGGGEGEATDADDVKAEKAEPEPAKAEPLAPELGVEQPAKPRTIEVGITGCKLDEEAEQPCADLCERIERGELAGVESVTLQSEQGSHADVTEVIDCLSAAGVTKLAIQKG